MFIAAARDMSSFLAMNLQQQMLYLDVLEGALPVVDGMLQQAATPPLAIEGGSADLVEFVDIDALRGAFFAANRDFLNQVAGLVLGQGAQFVLPGFQGGMGPILFKIESLAALVGSGAGLTIDPPQAAASPAAPEVLQIAAPRPQLVDLMMNSGGLEDPDGCRGRCDVAGPRQTSLRRGHARACSGRYHDDRDDAARSRGRCRVLGRQRASRRSSARRHTNLLAGFHDPQWPARLYLRSGLVYEWRLYGRN